MGGGVSPSAPEPAPGDDAAAAQAGRVFWPLRRQRGDCPRRRAIAHYRSTSAAPSASCCHASALAQLASRPERPPPLTPSHAPASLDLFVQATIRKRFRTYLDESMPVVEALEARGLVRRVSAEGSADAVRCRELSHRPRAAKDTDPVTKHGADHPVAHAPRRASPPMHAPAGSRISQPRAA